MNFLTFICNFFLLIAVAGGTLSPDNSKKSKKEKTQRRFGPVDKDVFQRGLVKENVKIQDILRDYGTYYKNTNLRHYVSGEFLGYITPWNSEGYENAKTFHGKFDMASPVWLVVNARDPFKIPAHDVQKSWLKDMKSLDNDNHTVKILPRLMFDGWSRDDIMAFSDNNQKCQQLVKALINLAKTYSFDGYVVEAWNQFVLSRAKRSYITTMISNIAEGLRLKNLDTVLAIPPLRGMKDELFTKKDFDTLLPYIRYFSLMTYDYSNIQRPGPNAPTEWIKKCIEYLVPDVKDIKRSQILMGLNFYGYQYTPEGGGAIIGSQYLKILEDFKGKIRWDDKSEEHFFEVKSDNGGFVFYPTLYSIMTRLEIANELKTGVAVWELGQGLTYFFDIL